MTRYQRIARKAIDAYLQSCNDKTVLLFTLSCVADEAACEAGRRSDLFPSLFDYERILPKGVRCRWIGENGEGAYYAINPYAEGEAPETTAIMAGPFDAAVDTFPLAPPMLPG